MSILNYFGAVAKKANPNQWWLPAMKLHREEEGDGWDDEQPALMHDGDAPQESAPPTPAAQATQTPGSPWWVRRPQDPSRTPLFTGGTPAPDPAQTFKPEPLRTPLSMSSAATPAVDGDPLTRTLQPLPSALDFNQARAKRAARTGVSYAVTGDARQDAINRRDALLNNRNPADTNGRGHSIVKGAVTGLARGLAAGGIGGGIAGAVTGAVRGGVAPNWDERIDRDTEAARLTQNVALTDAEEKRRLADADTRSQIGLRDAQTEFTKTTKVQEAAARETDRQKRQLLAQLRSIPSVDPVRHKVFLDAWKQTYGEDFDVDAYNNKKGNFVIRGIITDPAKPQELHDVAYNFADGTTRDLGLSGYAPPRDTSGMTESERRTDSDRDRGFNALQRQRSVTNELQRAGLNLSRERFDFSKVLRDDRLSENTRKEVGAAAKLRSDAEQAQMDADSFAGDGMYVGDDGKQHQAKWAVQKYKSALDKAEALRRQYFSSYGYLHAPDGAR
jgi:hypothetical protein